MKPLARHPKENRSGLDFKLAACAAVIVVACALIAFIPFWSRKTEESKEDRARIEVRTISKTCQTFRLRYGRLPTTLAELAGEAPDGGAPYLEGDSLVDPWGREYLYDASGTRIAKSGEPDVWTLGPDPTNASGIICNWQ